MKSVLILLAGFFKKRAVIITLSVVLTLATAFGIGAAIYTNTPEYVAGKALLSAIGDVTERDELETLRSALDGGSIAFSAKNVSSNESDGDAELGELSTKIYFTKESVFFDDLHIKSYDDTFDADIYLGNDGAYIDEYDIIGGKYGFIAGETSLAFQSSIFAPVSQSTFSLSANNYQQALNQLRLYDISSGSKELRRDIDKVYERYIKELLDVIREKASFESENEKALVGGEKKRVRSVYVVLDSECIADIVTHMYEYISEDDKITKLIDEHEKELSDMLIGKGGTYSVSTLWSAFLAQLKNSTNDFCENLRSDYYSSQKLTLQIVTPRTSSRLLRLTVNFFSNGQEMQLIDIDCGKDGAKKSDEIKISLIDGSYSATYTVNESSRKYYSSTVTVRELDTVLLSVSFDIDKKDETYTFGLSYNAEAFDDGFDRAGLIIHGTFQKDKRVTKLSADKIKTTKDGETVKEYTCDISIVIDEDDDMPDIDLSNVKSFAYVSETQLRKLLNALT